MSQTKMLLPRDLTSVRIDRRPESSDDQNLIEVVRHVFDSASIAAVNGALAANRPLLVSGEPGVGKSQLAAAVAAELGRPFVSFTANSRTEVSDLLWRFDAVARLAEAQLCGAIAAGEPDARRRLEPWRFVEPGPLWWGFAWEAALKHQQRRVDAGALELPADRRLEPCREGDFKRGVVVLIDEIDKCDSDVPNGLLEALGANQFTPQGCERVVAQPPTPLVIVATNEERILPDAFVRRCLVLHIPFPADALVERGRAHFGHLGEKCEAVLHEAAEQLKRDRASSAPPRPGVAEYLDLVRAVLHLQREQADRTAKDLIQELAQFIYRKQSRGAM